MTEEEEENPGSQGCKRWCNPVGKCLSRARGIIAKIWIWAGMIGLSVTFALLYTYCNPSNGEQCGAVSSYLGIIFLFLIFANYLLYTVIKDSRICCYGVLACCDDPDPHFHRSRDENTVYPQITPEVGNDVRAQDFANNMTFDLPSYDDALGMEKVEVTGVANKSFLPPDYEPPPYEVEETPVTEEPTAVTADDAV